MQIVAALDFHGRYHHSFESMPTTFENALTSQELEQSLSVLIPHVSFVKQKVCGALAEGA